jgi:hypothetical protein
MLWSMKSKPKPVTLRAQVPPDIGYLVRAIASLRDPEKDLTISDVVTEALQEFIDKPEIQKLIDQHNLRLGLEKFRSD